MLLQRKRVLHNNPILCKNTYKCGWCGHTVRVYQQALHFGSDVIKYAKAQSMKLLKVIHIIHRDESLIITFTSQATEEQMDSLFLRQFE